ncbi:MAG TPA: metallophosphoesterase [Papillibacter sp.]|nr:metallophosphoesterase [Papillibacter sp.]
MIVTTYEKHRPRPRPRRRRWLRALFILALLFILLLVDSNFRIEVTQVDIASSKIPPAFEGFTIAQLSDVHAAVFGRDNKTLIEKVKKAKPDIIAITGDIINNKDDLDIVRPLLYALVDIAPVYYVTGNHEWDSGAIKDLFALLRDAGVRTLRNEYLPLKRDGAHILLAGIDDPNGPYDMPKPEAVVAHIREKEGDAPYFILLAHRNRYLPRLAPLGVDLILAGHAHGGMIRLPFTDGLIGPSREWLPTYTSGIYTQESTTLFVSRGIGNRTGYPRFLNNPQLALLVLRSGALVS